MKKLQVIIFSTGLVLAFLATQLSALGPQNSPTAIAGSPRASEIARNQPPVEIRNAIASLSKAKEHLEHASHNFGGHRGAALKATDEAIRQLLIAQQYDK